MGTQHDRERDAKRAGRGRQGRAAGPRVCARSGRALGSPRHHAGRRARRGRACGRHAPQGVPAGGAPADPATPPARMSAWLFMNAVHRRACRALTRNATCHTHVPGFFVREQLRVCGRRSCMLRCRRAAAEALPASAEHSRAPHCRDRLSGLAGCTGLRQGCQAGRACSRRGTLGALRSDARVAIRVGMYPKHHLPHLNRRPRRRCWTWRRRWTRARWCGCWPTCPHCARC